MNFRIIKNYILGKSSPGDESQLLNWMQESDENERSLFATELAFREGRAAESASIPDIDKVEASLFEEIHRIEARRLKVRRLDRKSTRLNSSHANISYAVFCLKKK